MIKDPKKNPKEDPITEKTQEHPITWYPGSIRTHYPRGFRNLEVKRVVLYFLSHSPNFVIFPFPNHKMRQEVEFNCEKMVYSVFS